MAEVAILKITLLAILSQPFCIYLRQIWYVDWKWGPAARFTIKIHTGQKSKMAAAANLKSVKQPQLSHFSTDLRKNFIQTQKTGSRNRSYQWNSNFSKSKTVAAAILKIKLLAVNRPILHICAQNLIYRLKMGSCSQIYHQNSHRSKIQNGGGGHLEIR